MLTIILQSSVIGKVVNVSGITPSIKKNETNTHFSNGLVADKNNFDDDNRPKIISGRCNMEKLYEFHQ